ncbi:MAG TPA: HNH endonuclease signature motif containing protein, partial [Candidatus Saccharimonadales bacterium]
ENELEKDLQQEAAADAGVADTEEVEVTVKVTPPPPFVHTVRELIYWEYAKLMARAAGPRWENNYRFITSRFNKLKSGEIQWLDLDKENTKQMVREPKCEYCGFTGTPLTRDHIIPLVKGGIDIQNNLVNACKACNSSKGDRDVFDWYYNTRKETRLPKIVWSKYLKLVYEFHQLHRTLDKTDIDGNGQLDIRDLGAIFKKYEEVR